MSSTKYLILAATLIVLVNGAPPPPPPGDFMCQGTTLTIPETLNKARDACIAKMNPGSTFESLKDSKEPPKNISCMTLCLVQEIGLVTADYKFDSSKLTTLGKTMGVADTAVTSIVAAVDTCIKDKGVAIEIKDGKCEGIDTVLACAGMEAHKICAEKPSG